MLFPNGTTRPTNHGKIATIPRKTAPGRVIRRSTRVRYSPVDAPEENDGRQYVVVGAGDSLFAFMLQR